MFPDCILAPIGHRPGDRKQIRLATYFYRRDEFAGAGSGNGNKVRKRFTTYLSLSMFRSPDRKASGIRLVSRIGSRELAMLALNPYLTFVGNCADAMRFCQRIFGGKLDLMTFAQSPMCDQIPPGNGESIMHARLSMEGAVLMASDSMPGQPHDGMHGISLTLSFATSDEARRIFDTLADGGTVSMPLQATFWADVFGMLKDRFGTPWLVNGGMKPMP